jgi:hypothetical protein
MSRGLRRKLAMLACRILEASLPRALSAWGWAVRFEVEAIADDGAALRFALGSLAGFAPRLLASHLLRLFAALSGDTFPARGTIDMPLHEAAFRHPRALGVACAIGATALGLAYLGAAGAPMRYLAINAAALVIGLLMLPILGRAVPDVRRAPGAATLLMALVLLATALLGDRAEGATRWIALGGFFLQPSLVLLPVMIVGFARSRDILSTIALLVASAALAIQPDRAMAGMLAVALSVLALMRPDRFVVPALAGAVLGFGVTLIRPDTLPAVPFVDRILYSSFDVHLLAGMAVLVGSILLLVPAIVGSLYDREDRAAYSAFGIVWLTAIIAAAAGNYPTPIVGYGGSAVLGYVLSLTMLPKSGRSCVGVELSSRQESESGRSSERHLCVGIAGYRSAG